METTIKPKVIATLATIFLLSFAFAQSYEGDALTSYLGKRGESQEVKNLVATYKCDVLNPEHCFSNEGLELILRKGAVTEIRLHKDSKVYGNFKGKLPKSLRFGMTSSQVRGILGKPSISYTTSGYSEYQFLDYDISCWFEAGVLSQVTISAKPSPM